MVETLKVKLVPDLSELNKLKESLLGKIRGRSGGRGDSADEIKKGNKKRETESGKLLNLLKTMLKFVGRDQRGIARNGRSAGPFGAG